MKNKLRMITDFDVIETNGDTTSLLKSIRGISHELESSISPYHAIEIAKRSFLVTDKTRMTPTPYILKKFKNLVEPIEYFGEEVFEREQLIKLYYFGLW